MLFGQAEHRLGGYRRSDLHDDGPRDELLTTMHPIDAYGRTVGDIETAIESAIGVVALHA